MSVIVDTSGIENLELIFERFPEAASKAMSIAINTTVNDFVIPEARKDILAEVAFPEGYLDSSDKPAACGRSGSSQPTDQLSPVR